MILYFCPDMVVQSSGIRCLYRHVKKLFEHGFDVAILHQKSPFVMPDMPDVPICYLDQAPQVKPSDVIVIPEGIPDLMRQLSSLPVRRFVFAQSWTYIYSFIPDNTDWNDYGIERVMVLSPYIDQMVSWCMRLPTHRIGFGIDHDLYRHVPTEKTAQITFIQRKGELAPLLKRVLHSRNPAFTEQIVWKGLEGLSESNYAEEVRQSSIFLNLSKAEGLPVSCFEAMSAGTLVAGFSAISGHDFFVSEGDKKNCILAETGDYVGLAMAMESYLNNLVAGDTSGWNPVLRNARQVARPFTDEWETTSLVKFWQDHQ